MTALAAAAGGLVDQMLGEPPLRWHPVARYGATMQRIENGMYADRRANGIAFAAVGTGLGITVGLLMRRAFGPTLATVVATTVSAAGKMLDHEATAMGVLLHSGDLPAARQRIRSLVGRNTDDLDANEISRAVVESVAENCVDAVTSSLVWATIGGATGVLAHRAINTLDAMVGHHDGSTGTTRPDCTPASTTPHPPAGNSSTNKRHNHRPVNGEMPNERYERFGWASARLDDVVNYLPARITALATSVVRPARAHSILQTIRRDAPRHPSPNGGVVEAAFAAALGVQFGGVNRYADEIEDRGTLGDGQAPTIATIAAAVRLRQHSTATTALLLVAVSASVRLHKRRTS